MKKIFKFLPLALVGFALASCQSDELNVAPEAQHNPNALQIVTEGLEDGDYTRAGAISASTLKSTVLKWNTNDVLRVYDASLSMWDKYTYTGVEFADNVADFEPAADNSLESFSLGAFPADQVESAYLDKDDKTVRHLEMTVPDYYDYADKTFEDGTVGYKCDLPMYGTISALNTIAQMNYLTAMVRVNMLDVPKETKYLVLVDESAVRQPLAGRFIADIDGTNPPVLQTDGKFAAAEYQNGIIAKINPNAFLATPTAKDSAGIFLPVIAGQNYTNLSLYAVINPAKTLDGVGGIRDNIATGTFAAADYLKIASRAWNAPARKKVWWVRYTNVCYIDTDVLTEGFYPGHITAALNEHTKSIGELVIKPYSATGGAVKPLNPKEGDQFYHQVIIPKMVNGAKVTLDLSECGVLYTEALQIYRNTEDATLGEFKGDFKIIPGKIAAGSSATSKVEIKLPESNVEIVSDGVNPLGHLDVQNATQTTIGDGSTAVDLAGKTVTIQDGVAFIKKGVNLTGGTIIAKAYAGDATQFPTKITVEGGATVTTIDNDCQCNIDVISTDDNEAVVNTLDCAGVASSITIYSEGKANIKEIICPAGNAGTGVGGAQLLTIKSKLTNEALNTLAISSTAAKAGVDFGLVANTPAIYTAAQLVQAVAAGIADETYIMADELDLNNLPWVGLTTVSANFYGYNHDATTDTWKGTTNANKVVKTATGKNVIKNMKVDAVAGNGLIKNIDASAGNVEIAGIEFTSPSFSNTGAAVDNIGVVAGTIGTAAANNIELTNIKVTGLSVASKAGNGVGGLIGAITAAQTGNVIVTNADVAATSIAARSFVGGIVGRVSAAVAAINIFDSKANLASLSLSLADGVTTLYPLFAGTWASFIGGTQGNPVVALNIYDSDFGTAINKATKGNGVNNQGLRFGANADGNDVPFFGGNPWIGFCGTADPVASSTTLTTYKSIDQTAANKGKKFYKYVYGLNTMTVTRYEGNGAYAETTQKNLAGGTLYTAGVGANSVTYDGTNAAGVAASKVSGSWAWKDGKKYGTSIYSIYDTSELDPNALGYDYVYEPTSF